MPLGIEVGPPKLGPVALDLVHGVDRGAQAVVGQIGVMTGVS